MHSISTGGQLQNGCPLFLSQYKIAAIHLIDFF